MATPVQGLDHPAPPGEAVNLRPQRRTHHPGATEAAVAAEGVCKASHQGGNHPVTQINLKAELQSKLHSSEQTLEDVKREFNQLSVEVQEKLLVLSDHQEQIVVARDKRAMMEEHVEELKIGHRELQDEGEALIKEHSRLESNKQGWDRQLQELNSETMNLEQDKLVVLQKGLAIERDINSLRIAIEKNTHIIQCYKGECESIRHDTQDIEAEEKELSQKIIELKEQANHLEL